MGKLSGGDTDGPWGFVPRWLPPFTLLDAWNNGTSLRYSGEFVWDGSKVEALTFVQQDRGALTIFVDSVTGLLQGFETLRDDGVHGDVSDAVRFADYEALEGVLFPKRRTDLMNGEVARELSYRLKVNAALDSPMFDLPKDVESL